MPIKDITTSNVRTVTSDQKLGEVVSLMCLYRYSGIPVVDDGELKGIVAESDVAVEGVLRRDGKGHGDQTHQGDDGGKTNRTQGHVVPSISSGSRSRAEEACADVSSC